VRKLSAEGAIQCRAKKGSRSRASKTVLTISKEVNRVFSAGNSGDLFSLGVAQGCC
jgi:hypothetical protein